MAGVRREMITACCKLIKRSVFDGHACTFDLLATKFYVMLTDANVEIVILSFSFPQKGLLKSCFFID